MNCKTARANLSAFIDGELSMSRADRVREHLLACPECAHAADETRRLQQIAGAWTVEEADVWDGVRANLADTDDETLARSVRALEAELRALRAEVGLLRAEVFASDQAREHLAVARRSSQAATPYPCLRIV